MSVSDLIYSMSITMMVPLAASCYWKKEHDKSENADLKVCYVLYTLLLWVSDYLTSCLALFNIMLEIFLTCQRIRLIKSDTVLNQARQRPRPLVVCAILLTISLTVYLPVLFMNETTSKETRNETTGSVRKDYFYQKTDFGKSSGASRLAESITIMRMCLVIVILTIANTIASVLYGRFYRKKNAILHVIRGLDQSKQLSLFMENF
jgi:hypothetical protein